MTTPGSTSGSEHDDWLASLDEEVRGKLCQGAKIAQAVVDDARAAEQYWALLEALDEKLCSITSPLASRLEKRPVRGLFEVRRAIGEAAILATMRLSDNSGDDRLTACSLAKLLGNKEVVKALSSPYWFTQWGRSSTDQILLENSAMQPSRITWFCDRVPESWTQKPVNIELLEARDGLRKFRDEFIAHSLQATSSPPTRDAVKTTVSVARNVANYASMMFRGTVAFVAPMDRLAGDGAEFWDVFEFGFITTRKDLLDLVGNVEFIDGYDPKADWDRQI